MRIDHTAFGEITINGKTYDHDAIIRLSGEIAKRKKRLSKKLYGISHVVSMDEAKYVFEKGCRQLILGSGQDGNVQLSPEADAFFAKKNSHVLIQPTPQAIRAFNEAHGKKIGLFHVTCWQPCDVRMSSRACTREGGNVPVSKKIKPRSISRSI
jgi:hypothetical protein